MRNKKLRNKNSKKRNARKNAKKNVKKNSKNKRAKVNAKNIARSNLKIDFISSNVLNKKSEKSRITYILDIVKDGTILVTDGVMSPDEELDLIRETMRKVDDGFPGIEVCSLKREAEGYQRFAEQLMEQRYSIRKVINKIIGRASPQIDLKYGMTLIGPSRLIKKIKKSPDSFSVFAQLQK